MKKIILMLFVAAFSQSVIADAYSNNNCYTREGFQIGASVGFQNQVANQKDTGDWDFNGIDDLGDLEGEDLANAFKFATVATDGTETQVGGNAKVQGEALNYNTAQNWTQGAGLMALGSMGYKGLFGCGQYSYGISTSIGYEGSFSTSTLMADGIVATIDSAAPVSPATVFTNTVSGVDSYSDVAGTIQLKGGLTIGLMTSLGKEFSWGNVSAQVGVKFKQFTLNYLTTEFAETVDADNSVINVDGYSAVDGLDGENLNTYVSENYKKWGTALSIGFTTQYYISDNLSMGLSVVYDMYAPVKFTLDNVAIASRAADEEEQLTVGENAEYKFQNNTMGIMMNLTYTFGNASN